MPDHSPRRGVHRVGTVLQAMQAEKRHADKAHEYWAAYSGPARETKLVSNGMEYYGPETSPFEAYIRWGRHRVILASICHLDERTGCGRMAIIMGALERLCGVVDVECVGNPHLARWLYRNGYRAILEPGQPHEAYPTNYRKRDGITPPECYYGNTLDEERG